MTFIELILKTTPEELDVKHIQRLIDDRVEESLILEYKSIDKFDDIPGLSKHVSSFANSAGGLIILGVEEDPQKERIFPKEIRWGPESYRKENLEQRLNSNIHYPIRN